MRPRLAHVISTQAGVGGAERLLTALVQEGDARGWDQLVLNPFAASAELAGQFRLGQYGSEGGHGPAGLARVQRWLRSELSQFRPDLVHAILFRAVVMVAAVPRRRTPARVQTHAYGEWVRLPPYALAKERVDRWAARRYDGVVAISEGGRQMLVEDYGLTPQRVRHIPPGWQGEPLPRRARERPLTVLCVAKLRPEKGHDVLLGAVALVRREIPDLRVVLVGEGPMRPALEGLVAKLGLTANVEIVGAAADIWPLLADADVFALTSRSEAFGIAVVEAMAAGLPVVGSAVGGIAELVVPGLTGELFPPGDYHALAEKLLAILRDPGMRTRMGLAGQLAAEPYRRETTLQRYFALFEEFMGDRRGSRHPHE